MEMPKKAYMKIMGKLKKGKLVVNIKVASKKKLKKLITEAMKKGGII